VPASKVTTVICNVKVVRLVSTILHPSNDSRKVGGSNYPEVRPDWIVGCVGINGIQAHLHFWVLDFGVNGTSRSGGTYQNPCENAATLVGNNEKESK
jgi:hypothetical protein